MFQNARVTVLPFRKKTNREERRGGKITPPPPPAPRLGLKLGNNRSFNTSSNRFTMLSLSWLHSLVMYVTFINV